MWLSHLQDTVDKKIVEQLEEFEMSSETRRRIADMPSTLPVPWGMCHSS